jgi:5-methylcytosine-specific restriction endonuclease McrA
MATNSTDVGTTKRKRLSPRERLSVWEKHKGVCALCHLQINGVREKWIVEHMIALELGGADDESNMAPVHKACADEKTNGKRGDHAMAAKAKRAKRRHLGIKESKNPLPGGKGSKWKKTMSGKVVLRED